MTEQQTQDFPPESWVFLVSRMGDDSYLIYHRGEISLVDTTGLIEEVGKILKGEQP